jgi:pilus assembly protein Flp/PilA
MKNLLMRFWRDEDGLETVEWAVVAAVVIGGAIVAFRTLGTNVGTAITNLSGNIS